MFDFFWRKTDLCDLQKVFFVACAISSALWISKEPHAADFHAENGAIN
jgi:hypothetical protein